MDGQCVVPPARMTRWNVAYRRAYQEFCGPIPEGCVVHHRCGNPLCENPAHLELLTPKEHAAVHLVKVCPHGKPTWQCDDCERAYKRDWAKRAYVPKPVGRGKAKLLWSTCHLGHPLSGDNLYVTPDGRRQCRTCRRGRASSRAS